MSNRMLRDWTASEKINSMSLKAEIFFTRLIMKADDYGCYYADPRLLRANLFPLKIESVSVNEIRRLVNECREVGVIIIYTVNKKEYLQIIDFKQRLDRARAKFPLPNDSMATVNDFPPEVEVEEEREEEKEKEVERGKASPSIENPFSDKFLNSWLIWKDYKKKEFGFSFKSFESEQASLNDLVKKSEGLEEIAIKIIRQSMANGWKGLFTLKNEKNGQQLSRPEIASSESAAEYDKLFASRYGNGGSAAS